MSELEAQGKLLEGLQKRLDEGSGAVNVDAVLTHSHKHINVTVAELKAAARSNPGHTHADVYLKAVEGYTDDRTVDVAEVDLQALMQNREVVHTRTTEGAGNTKSVVVRKELGGICATETA